MGHSWHKFFLRASEDLNYGSAFKAMGVLQDCPELVTKQKCKHVWPTLFSKCLGLPHHNIPKLTPITWQHENWAQILKDGNWKIQEPVLYSQALFCLDVLEKKWIQFYVSGLFFKLISEHSHGLGSLKFSSLELKVSSTKTIDTEIEWFWTFYICSFKTL